jgi:hypothetical protein
VPSVEADYDGHTEDNGTDDCQDLANRDLVIFEEDDLDVVEIIAVQESVAHGWRVHETCAYSVHDCLNLELSPEPLPVDYNQWELDVLELLVLLHFGLHQTVSHGAIPPTIRISRALAEAILDTFLCRFEVKAGKAMSTL